MDTDSKPENAARRAFHRRDIILIASLLLVALLFMMIWKSRPSKDGRVCSVLYDRQVVMTVPLDQDQVFSLEGLPQVVFEVRGGRAAFIHSDCPDQICVHTGFIGESGQLAACLPNRVALRIGGEGGGDAPDTVAR